MEQSLGERRWKAVRRLLQWVAWAARPLNFGELEHAMAARDGVDSIDPDDILSIQRIVSWSGGLLFIDDESLVRVIHPTTNRFFSQRGHELFADGDATIAHACIHYLQMGCIQKRVMEQFGAKWTDARPEYRKICHKNPFLKYATGFMAVHIQRSPPKDDDTRAAAFLLSDARRVLSQGLYFINRIWSLQDDVAALHVAAHLSLIEVVSQLLAKGESIDSQEHLGRTPLMCALDSPPEFRTNRTATVERLLSAGADVSIVCSRGSTALSRAMMRREDELVERLLQLPDVGINTVPEASIPALSFAIRKCSKSVTDKILARPDIGVNLRDLRDGSTALHHAIIKKDLDMLETLISREELAMDTVDEDDGQTPLFLDADVGFARCVEVLIDQGANIYHLDRRQGTAVMRAASTNRADVVRFMMSRGADIHQRDRLGRTALHLVSVNNAWAALEVLLSSRDVDVDCQDEHGETALHGACKSSDATGAKMLVAAGARCDIRDSQGLTPVDVAASNGRDEVLEVLRAAPSANTHGRDTTPACASMESLCEAARSDPLETLRERIATAASADEIDRPDTPYSGTPLAVACEFASAGVAAMLLDAGADPDRADGFNRTPCLRTLTRGSIACLEALLLRGANFGHLLPGEDHPLRVRAMRRGDRQHVILWLLRHGGAQVVRYGKDNNPRAWGWARDLQQALVCAIRSDDEVAARRLVEARAPLDGIQHEGYPAAGATAAELARRLGAEAVTGYLAGLPEPAQGQGGDPVGRAAAVREMLDGPEPLLGHRTTPGLADLRRMLPVALFLLLLAVLEASRSASATRWHQLRRAGLPDQ